MNHKYQIVFFGSPKFVLPVLEFLYRNEELVGIVTQPDKPKGRGLKILPSPVKIWAQERNLKIFEPNKIKEETFLRQMEDLSPDLIIVFAYGKILPKELLEIPREGAWNIHLSLLPKYRGASPVQWTLLNGEIETGVTIMLMDEGLDTGPILLQKKIAIAEEDNSISLTEKLSELSVHALEEALTLLKDGKLIPKPQNHEEATYAPLIKKEDGYITFNEEATLIERKVRAFYPWPGTYTKFRDKILKIHSAKAMPNIMGHPVGSIIKIDKEGLLVATTKGALLLKEVQLEGRQRVSAYQFAIGQRLKVGDLLL